MERVLVLGRGGAGKTTFAQRLGEITDLPVIELDTEFWSDDLTPLSAAEWTAVQQRLAAPEQWIMDGDLGPHDAPGARMQRADTIILLDLSLARCVWRARRRGPERRDFWWWVLTWRLKWRSHAVALATVAAPEAELVSLHSPHQIDRYLQAVRTEFS